MDTLEGSFGVWCEGRETMGQGEGAVSEHAGGSEAEEQQ